MRKLLIIALVLFAMVGFATAETINGWITKVDAGKITVVTGKFNKEEKKFDLDPEKTYDLAKDVKVMKVKGGFGFGGKFGKKKKDDEDKKEEKKEEKKAPEPEKSSLEDLTKAVEKASEGKGFVKGTFAKIETNDSGKVTSITYNTGGFGGGKGGKGKGKKKDE